MKNIKSNINAHANNNNKRNENEIVDNQELSSIKRLWKEYGYHKGSELYAMHKMTSLGKINSNKELKYLLVYQLGLDNMSSSKFDKLLTLYNKERPNLMSAKLRKDIQYFSELMVGN